MSPTSKALKILRERGYICDIVERRITRKIKRDWCGIADIIADHPASGGTLALQVTDKTNFGKHVTKIKASPNLAKLKECGWYVEVWGFAKGASKASMIPRVVQL